MDDILRKVLTDVLAMLENGVSIQATSIIHAELRTFATPYLNTEELSRKVQEVKEDLEWINLTKH